MEEQKCPICLKALDDGGKTFVLTDRGASSVNEAGQARGEAMDVAAGQRIHADCRRDFCNKKSIKSALKRKQRDRPETPPTRRSMEPKFQFSDQCFLCGMSADTKADDVFTVRSLDFHKSIIKACDERSSDDPWADTIRGRLACCIDLHAADAIYHGICSVNFRTGKQIPKRYRRDTSDTVPPKKGRRKDSSREEAFLQVVNDLRENDYEQITVTDLVEEMSKLCAEPYSAKYMRQRLTEHFGVSVVITNINGRENVVTFRSAAAQILQDFYDTPKLENEAAEKHRIIKTAAELIKSDVKCINTSKMEYPDINQLGSVEHNLGYLPESLMLFLSDLFPGKSTGLKVATIGQCIMQCTRPRSVLAPIPFGLGVQMHHLYGSRFLVDSLNSHGLCLSYDEILHFSKCAANSHENFHISGHFGHYIADNVDHNLRTLDGRGTFHGMGLVVAFTPEVKKQHHVHRLQDPSHGVPAAKIAIRYYKGLLGKRSSLLYQKIPDIIADDLYSNLDLLWRISLPLHPRRPGWSGMMQAVCKGDHPGKSSVHFLPMIDMDPTNMSCIYSTLLFVVSENIKHGTVPILTFDQPLWFKARTIIHHEEKDSELRTVVLKLGSFHTMMSYLGCIGHLMNASGLREVLELIYAENAVDHILSGKAYARAFRAHTLVNAALNTMLVSEAFGITFCGVECSRANEKHLSEREDLHPDLKEAAQILDDILVDKVSATQVCKNDVINNISVILDKHKSKVACFITGQLWLQYMSMTELLHQFLRAERTGNFLLHLSSLQKMLPYLAASGHSNYTKSAQIYISDMVHLKKTNPFVYDQFLSGKFVIRRTDRFWAGLSTDLVIEQVLMRTIKSTGGLTRGRGMEESQMTRWLLALPVCASVNENMQKLTGARYCTSNQHKEISESRISRDCKDTDSIHTFLLDRNPLEQSDCLRNIATGVTADKAANPHRAVEIGSSILEKMTGQNVFTYTLKRTDTARIMGQKIVSTGNETVAVPVDPQLLFQRLLLVANSNPDRDLNGLFKYELASHPTSLFDKNGLPREPNKPQLADALQTCAPTAILSDVPTHKPEFHVVDGGSLLHRIPWKKNETYEEICEQYVNHVHRNYANPIVVFDGYAQGATTKDITHARRTKGIAGPRVSFSETMPLKSKKEQFLSNAENKLRFINLLMEKMEAKGIKTLCADGDADVLIVKTAVKCSATACTHLIGEDTDLLMLLCLYCDNECRGLVFRSEINSGEKETKRRIWDIVRLRQQLGEDLCRLLPVIHALGGCDTTSRLFGIGKGTPLKKIRNDEFKKQVEILTRSGLSAAEVQKAGEQALVMLYGGKPGETLDELRARKFSEKVATSASCVQVQTLPPTSDSARYHSYRVYFQAQVWMGSEELNPRDWGWQLSDGRLLPKKMDLLPAPDYLLKIIRCQCKGDCDTLRCSCRKNAIDCTSSCTGCRGSSCSNATHFAGDSDHEEE